MAVHAPVSGAAAACPTPPGLLDQDFPLPRLATRLSAGEPLRIVTLGSSSTAGFGASSLDKTYPEQLREILQAHLPDVTVEVINSGINGQLAAEMADRLYRDAIALDADLVIWQTGTNDALSRVDLDEFRDHLERGAEWLAEAGIDLIFVDPQYYPGVRNQSAYERYVAVMAEVSAARGAPLFPRYAIMRHWAFARSGPAVLGGDRFHMNDQGYTCLADLLSEVILRAATRH